MDIKFPTIGNLGVVCNPTNFIKVEKTQEQIEKELGLIEKWSDIQDRLTEHFKKTHSDKITNQVIFESLFLLLAEKEKLKWLGSLWDVELEYDAALNLLSNFNFDTVLSKIQTTEGLIPRECLIEYKVRIKARGQIWVIHKYDLDPFPSNPHAHDIQNNIKLDLSNGNCYRVRQYIYTVKKKDLLIIRQQAQVVFEGTLPELAI